MPLEVKQWTIKEIKEIWDRIDPKPQYQRSPVWNEKRKKLLIDSIFKDYDIPKIYFNKLENNNFFNFEIADGQQRLRAIIDFLNNEYQIDEVCFGNECYRNVYYKDLSLEIQDKYLKTSLTITTLIDVSTEKVRDIFARLQMGVGLNQAELRRAIASNIGFYVQSIIENHTFFKSCGIPNSRNKHQDYIDHCIGYLCNGFSKDMKGNVLKDLYLELSASDTNQLIKQTTLILTQMEKVNHFKKGIFKNKWAFVDTFIFLSKNLNQGKKFRAKKYFELFIDIETKRKKYNKNPEILIEKYYSTNDDKRLYDYIIAFKTAGALKANIIIRSDVFDKEFISTIY